MLVLTRIGQSTEAPIPCFGQSLAFAPDQFRFTKAGAGLRQRVLDARRRTSRRQIIHRRQAVLGGAVVDWVLRNVVEPTLSGLEAECGGYQGILYVGLMLTEDGPKVLEYNARFGDPETQVVLPRLETDLVDLFEALSLGRLGGLPVRWDANATVCVVMASAGYPGKYPTGLPITGLDAAGALEGVVVFHAGTDQKDGQIVTAGGRVLGVTARDRDLESARKKAYDAVARIRFDGMAYRTDIGRV